MAILPFPKMKMPLPPGRMCRVTLYSAAFYRADQRGPLPRSIIAPYDMRTDEVDAFLAQCLERGGVMVGGELGVSATWLPYPCACVDVALLEAPPT